MRSLRSRASTGVVAMILVAAAAMSAGLNSAAAANPRHARHPYASPHVHHYYSGAYRARPVPGRTLPYGPEYGFLRHVPPNAVRGPGYTYVPGVGILGESVRSAFERLPQRVSRRPVGGGGTGCPPTKPPAFAMGHVSGRNAPQAPSDARTGHNATTG